MKRLPLFVSLLISVVTHAQSYQWIPTPAPTTTFRYEDVYFLNNDTGFAVHYGSAQQYGFIARTTDGGISWTTVLDSMALEFRDIGFTDELHGWIGTYHQTGAGSDTSILYQTTDGGMSWSPVSNLPGPVNAGICGLRVINDSTICGVGRYSGPCGFYKTTNNGLTWSYVDLSSQAQGLVDIFFFNADTGFVVGNVGPGYSNGYGRILYTTDGGATWTVHFTSVHLYTLCWKISFPSRSIGYISMQMWNGAPKYFLKTIDGGASWQEFPYPGGPTPSTAVQGIGFVNDSVGWVGGGSTTYSTNNGGATWSIFPNMTNVNRFRFLSDTVAYCAGETIYRMQVSPVGINDTVPDAQFRIYPNPTSGNQQFEFFVYRPGRVKLTVLDVTGKEVVVLIDQNLASGNQYFVWPANELANGFYTYRLEQDGEVITQKFIVEK